MSQHSRTLVTGIAAGIGAVVLIGAVVGLYVVYSGSYNIAATEEHTSFVRWAFDTTFHRSIERRGARVEAPPAFTEVMVETGAGEYKAMCQHCHGGPGVERSDWASGMRPRPPMLTEAAAEWRPREVFWLVKHGARMTGMPAFGPTHDDETLWSIVAMVKQLPAMTPERYAALGAGHGHGGGGDRAGPVGQSGQGSETGDDGGQVDDAHHDGEADHSHTGGH